MKVKISKSKLRQMVLEEAASLLTESFSPMTSRATPQIKSVAHGGRLNEMWGESVETGSGLITFAKAYTGLGAAVQEQFEALVHEWNINGAHTPDWEEAVYEQNPNAIDMVEQRLTSVLKQLSQDGNEDAEVLLDVIEGAQTVYRQGDAEVEADASAAGDR